MKTKLLFTLFFAFIVQFTTAQVTITTAADVVTFTFDDNTGGDLYDAIGNPVYLYSWVDSTDASNGAFNTLAGGWPGTTMTDLGGNIYSFSVDLSTFYPTGTVISEIKFILNDNMGSQTADLLGTNYGYAPYTLSILDITNQNNTISFIDGKLVGSDSVVYSIYVYNILAQQVKSFNNQHLNQNDGLDLNLPKNEIFIIKLESVQGSKIIKVLSK